MRIVKLKGGVGNQMFQYAFAKLIEQETGDTVRLDYSSYGALVNDPIRVPRLKKFNITLEPASPLELSQTLRLPHRGNSLRFGYKVGIYLEKTINRDYAFEPNRAYIPPERILDRHYFDGYWQSWRYTDRVWETLKREFTPNYSLDARTGMLAERMRGENSVFVGVRKGDYAETKADFRHFGVFEEAYYLRCMEYIEAHVAEPVYYVFSNDVDWCKRNLAWGGRTVIYREPEEQVGDFEELMLMAACRHAVIVNSTFHWWGARLDEHEGKIVCCPDKWFFDGKPIDIIPDRWVRIKT